MRYILSCLIFLAPILLFAQDWLGAWTSDSNKGYEIEFTPTGLFFEYHKGEKTTYKGMKYDSNEMMIEVDYGELQYKAKAVAESDSTIIQLIGSKNKQIYREKMLLRCKGNKLVVVIYKTLPGIENHIQVASLFTRKGAQHQPIEGLARWHFILPAALDKDLITIAFNQKDGEPCDVNSQGEAVIRIPSNGILKTQLREDAWVILNGNIRFSIEKDGKLSPIPTLQASDRARIYHEVRDPKLKSINIVHHPDQRVAICSARFNPGRKRVVNPLFGEEIKGNVNSFSVSNYRKELNYLGFDFGYIEAVYVTKE